MPRAFDPEHYSLLYPEYVRMAGLEGRIVRIPKEGPQPDDEIPGKKRLAKLRADYYAFIMAVKRQRREGNQKWMEVADWADQTVCYLHPTENCIYLYPRSKSWQSKLLATGGEVGPKAGTPQAVSTAQASLERLQKLTAKPKED